MNRPPGEFRRPFSSIALADLITDAAMDLLAAGGPDRVTLGSVARELVMQPSSLHYRTGGLASMLTMLVECFAWRWNRWATNPYDPEGLLRLPRDEATLEAARVWFALVEIAGGEHRAGRPEALAELRRAVADERDALAYRIARDLERPLTPVEAHLVLAVTVGMRFLVTHGLVELSALEAHEVATLLIAVVEGG